jgi:hypothetical protein
MSGHHQNKLRIRQKTKKPKRTINLVTTNTAEILYPHPGLSRTLIEEEDSYPGKDGARFVKVYNLTVFFQTDDFIMHPKLGEFSEIPEMLYHINRRYAERRCISSARLLTMF